MNDFIPEKMKVMRACVKETLHLNSFLVVVASAIITADEPVVRGARGRCDLSQFGTWSANGAYLTNGYVAESTAITVARRNFPKQFLQYHRAGHSAITSPQTQRGYAAFVHTNTLRALLVPVASMLARRASLRWRMMLQTRTSRSCCWKTRRMVLITTRSGRTCRRRRPSFLAK
jgi:hypothetical protein